MTTFGARGGGGGATRLLSKSLLACDATGVFMFTDRSTVQRSTAAENKTASRATERQDESTLGTIDRASQVTQRGGRSRTR